MLRFLDQHIGQYAEGTRQSRQVQSDELVVLA
jgi:hypothetical protein